MNYRAAAPAEWNAHWDAMPNSVRALYATFRSTRFPWRTEEIQIEAWGQLCFDDAAARAVAYHMWNHRMRTDWVYLSWRVEMDGPCLGGAKKSGVAPDDFQLSKYGPPAARLEYDRMKEKSK